VLVFRFTRFTRHHRDSCQRWPDRAYSFFEIKKKLILAPNYPLMAIKFALEDVK